MTHIEKQLQIARPSLRVVSPMSWWVVLVMAAFNVVLGLSLFLGVDENRLSASLLIVNDFLTFKFWGVVFIVLGLLKFWSLFRNNWKLARQTLFMGVSVKAAWMVALTIRSLVSPGTIFVNLLWVTVALIQMGCYVWFMPPSAQTNVQEPKV